MKKVAFYTLGCKVNQYETEAMMEAFEKEGYEVVDYNSFADIYIINTCTVTNMGERKSRQVIRRALDFNSDAFIAVVGCYSQIAPDEVFNIEGVKLILGTNERAKIVQMAEKALKEDRRINAVGDIMEVDTFENMEISQYKGRTRAFLKIQEGCDQYCSYCIIPYARGHIRSREPKHIIEEVTGLVESGFKEVVLTGIHVGSYGKDFGDVRLIDIIEKVHRIPGLERIRMSSIEPKTLNKEFIERLSNLDKVCRHFHLSLQSGCDETLKRMNRKYTTAEYREVVDNLRSKYHDVGITTDIIVGFPGETEEEFEKTLEFVKDISFSDMHIFKYSPRKGTSAASFKDQVPRKVKNYRSKVLLEVAKKNQRKFIEGFVGKKIQVLFEQELKDKEGFYEGLTHNYIRVIAESAYDVSGEILETKIVKAKDGYGEAIIV